MDGVMRMLCNHDSQTARHCEAVSALSVQIARELGVTESIIYRTSVIGLFHDIGKIRICSALLNRLGTLMPGEWSLIHEHASEGSIITRGWTKGDWLSKGISQHHERIDGSGYPGGLVGGDIMLEAMIVAAADTIDCMRNQHIYHGCDVRLTNNQIRYELSTLAGKKIDIKVIEAAISVV